MIIEITITDLPITVASEVVLGLLVFLMIMEQLVHNLEHWSHKRGLLALVEKLEKELMMMGIISFLIFCFQNFANGSLSDPASVQYMAFEMADMIVLFMALAFCIQAAFLVAFASHYGKIYVSAMRTTIESLINSYNDMKGETNRHRHTLSPPPPHHALLMYPLNIPY